jgi:5-methylcytosine-specific restriction endonuclease McrA
MREHVLSHLGDAELIRDLGKIAAKDRLITAALLAHLAEMDLRRLYAPVGYPSMESYCIHELRFSDDVAHKRIRAARKAREYPVIFEMLADGRLSLSGLLLLGVWLKPENATELLAAAAHKTRQELEELIADRFPRTEVLPLVVAMGEAAARPLPESSREVAPGPPVNVVSPKVTPIAHKRYILQLAISKETHGKLEYAQALMSHLSCDLARVFDRALDSLIAKLEKDRCGAASKPRAKRRPTLSQRHVPSHVKLAVWKRDGGRCTFTTETGHRCPARDLLQYDHIDPVARGGEATVENLRLRCRTHNQLDAEQAFGKEFIAEKRETARRERAATRQQAANAKRLASPDRDADPDPERDVVPWLRQLRCRPEHIRLAASHCESLPEGTSLDDRVREAVRFVGRLRFPGAVASSAPATAG